MPQKHHFLATNLGHCNIAKLTINDIVKLCKISVPNLNTQNLELLNLILKECIKCNTITGVTFKLLVNKIIGIDFKTSSGTCLDYWKKLGWNEEEANNKKMKYCEYGNKIFSDYHDKCKKDNKLYRQKSLMCEEYWIKRGFTKDQASEQISKIGRERSINFIDLMCKSPHKQTTRIEYWLSKGYSTEESKIKLKDRQSTFSYDKCIKKFGEKEGYIIWLERQNKWQKTLIQNGYLKELTQEEKTKFDYYKKRVWSITKIQPIETLENYSNRGKNKNDYHLDHIFSIYDGFLNKIQPEIIGSIINLRFIPAKQNLQKHKRSEIDKEFLLKLFEDHNNDNGK